MSRQLTLLFEELTEVHDISIHTLSLIASIIPLLTPASTTPINFKVDNEEDARVFRMVVKWLKREVIVSDMVLDRSEFLATVRFADKWNIPLLLRELDVIKIFDSFRIRYYLN